MDENIKQTVIRIQEVSTGSSNNNNNPDELELNDYF